MPQSSLFKFINNLHECCYIVLDVLKINEVLYFWASQINVIKSYLRDGEEFSQNEPLHWDKIPVDNKCFTSETYEPRFDVFISSSNSNQNEKSKSFILEKESPQCKTPVRTSKLKTSTPFDADAILNSKQDIDLQCRVFNLEQEVKYLKKQIESLSRQASSGSCENSFNHAVIPKIVLDHCPPPPPPPPPPLIFRSPLQFKRKRSCVIPLKDNNSSSLSTKLDMTLVLKGLKDVKLKRTDRSPGGTPMRKTKPVSNDPNDILQEALKKRFDVMHPEEDKENIADLWDKSPNSSFSKDA